MKILDLSRIEAGRYSINDEPLLLTDIASECIHMMNLKARNKDIALIPQFETGMLRLVADERSIRQILLNLMANAVKFTPPNGKIYIKVGWTAGGGQYISVRDTGPGIPPGRDPHRSFSFRPRVDRNQERRTGNWSGLPIVQALVHVHDGEFHLFSKLREGTEALATFPRSRVLQGTQAKHNKPSRKKLPRILNFNLLLFARW